MSCPTARMRGMPSLFAATASALLALGGCGQTGPLYLPDDTATPVPKTVPVPAKDKDQKRRDEEKQPPQ